MDIQIKKILDKIPELCKLHGVVYMAIFGSAALSTMNENSDIDLLVQFNENIDTLDYADNFFSLHEKLEKLTGKKVDLITQKSLKNPVLIQEIENTKIDFYAA